MSDKYRSAHFACGSHDERMHRSCRRVWQFENHLISFVQRAICIIVQFVENCSNLVWTRS